MQGRYWGCPSEISVKPHSPADADVDEDGPDQDSHREEASRRSPSNHFASVARSSMHSPIRQVAAPRVLMIALFLHALGRVMGVFYRRVSTEML